MQLIYGENATYHIESGKAVSRALRGHFLIYDALMSKLVSDILSPEDENIKKLYTSFVSGKVTTEEIVNSPDLNLLERRLSDKKDFLSCKSRTAKLWIQYIYYINILKLFISAERTGDWHSHLLSVSKMLNLFAATGHINYAKCARLYLQQMNELPSKYPDIYEKFVSN